MGEVIKSGWLYRRSLILGKWKKTWAVLYLNGGLTLYTDDSCSSIHKRIFLPNEVVGVVSNSQIVEVTPPEGTDVINLFALELTDGENLYLCGDTEDDMRAWKMALEETLLAFRQGRHQQQQQQAPFGYYMPFPPQPAGHARTYTHTADGRQIPVTVQGASFSPPPGYVYVAPQQPYTGQYYYMPLYGTYDDRSPGFGTGMFTGMALGSLLFWPWFPFGLGGWYC